MFFLWESAAVKRDRLSAELRIAAAYSDELEARKLVRDLTCIDVNSRDSAGFTALHSAIRGEYLPVASLLVDEQRAMDRIRLAAGVDKLTFCKLLIESGARVNSIGPDGHSPLHYAIASNRVDICILLLDNGARVNTPGAPHNAPQPLYFAVQNRNAKICDMLISRGAEVNNTDNPGSKSALHVAAMKGLAEICTMLLLKGAALDYRSKAGHSALSLCSAHGHTDVVILLLSHGADVNTQCCKGRNPLHECAMIGNEYISAFLVNNGARIDVKDELENTPIHAAAYSGSLGVCKLLVSHGSDLRTINKVERSCLHMAALSGSAETLEFLLKELLDIDALKHQQCNGSCTCTSTNINDLRDKWGYTLLHVAAEKGRTSVCKMLVNNGIDVSAVDKKGNTALAISQRRGHKEVENFLRWVMDFGKVENNAQEPQSNGSGAKNGVNVVNFQLTPGAVPPAGHPTE